MFSNNTQEQIGFYVYALFSSRESRLPFYIGKGRGNRVFAHAQNELSNLSLDDQLSLKQQTIRNVISAGGQVIHKIIRHGLTESESLKIESALIDLLNYTNQDCLTNAILGHGVSQGICDAYDLEVMYSAPDFDIGVTPVVLIKIERQWNKLVLANNTTHIPLEELFMAAKGDWKISLRRVEKAKCVFAVARGITRAAFVSTGWESIQDSTRKRMTGFLVDKNYDKYIGKSVSHVFDRGSQNPIRYINC